ncbi:hypothetical protein KQX54_021565 [Cotesia glomerata]|uniref:Uncharacterized protein n=1 Tax=Cotesia glomerata TaxID=32391 RepID=A0AAV7JAI1_COTGL|nr:hypothetical protein KQX54_021565 [Cotesia glomerata]
MCAMYFYASKLTAAALSAGLRGGGGGGGGGGHSTSTGAVCRCHETPGNDSAGNKGINAAPAELRSPGPSLRQLGKFSPPPPSKSTHRAPQQNYGNTNSNSSNAKSVSAGVSSAISQAGFGPTTSEHVFVTANIEHRSNHHHQHHRHRSKHKLMGPEKLIFYFYAELFCAITRMCGSKS